MTNRISTALALHGRRQGYQAPGEDVQFVFQPRVQSKALDLSPVFNIFLSHIGISSFH